MRPRRHRAGSGSATTARTPLRGARVAVAALIEVAHERGITAARINLHPAELGGINVRIHVTAAGVSADVVADSAEAAQVLAETREDLRGSLELTLVSLTVSCAGDDPSKDAGLWQGNRNGRSSRADQGASSVLELPGGLLVEVLD